LEITKLKRKRERRAIAEERVARSMDECRNAKETGGREDKRVETDLLPERGPMISRI